MAKIKNKAVNKQIEINEKFEIALDLLENTNKNIFITGRAGTGKSTLLEHFRNTTNKKIVVLAPTGVAALNVKGQTIHSFFGFKIDVVLKKIKKMKDSNLYKNIDIIIIDEISMVRSDLLDCVDKFLRLNGKDKKKPFGGIQMVFIGDLYQLPPVVSKDEKEIFSSKYQSQYFFDSKVFKNIEIEFVELEKIYRQSGQQFINLLNAIRNKSVTEEDLALINKRVNPHFQENDGDYFIYLTTTNKMANIINNRKLDGLNAKLFSSTGKISGDFDKKYLPTQINLNLKIGSQIMFLNNDSEDRWVNGSIGKITDIIKDTNSVDYFDNKETKSIIKVELQNGNLVEVTPYKWKIFKFSYNKKRRTIDTESVGSFTQFPLKLAWAVTIHKSQGKTFNKVILDIGSGTFAHGQVYVALSRCTSLEGLILKKPIAKKHILMDYKVIRFLTDFQSQKSEEKCSLEDKIKIITKAVTNNTSLDIVYLKANDTKSKRTITPRFIGKMEYKGKAFLGVKAFCEERQQERTFKVNRILEIVEDSAVILGDIYEKEKNLL